MPAIVVTELTFQFDIFELKLDARWNTPSNMLFMFVTKLTSHFERSEVMSVMPLNMPFMSVTNFTHQSPIKPY